MIKVFIVGMQKGGVGKTTSVVNLSYEYAKYGAKTLILDGDQQANATKSFGINPATLEQNISQIYEGNRYDPKDLILSTPYDNLFILPASKKLAGVIEKPPMGSEGAIKRFLGKVWNDFDYVFIDTPAGINPITPSAMAAATDVLLPIQAEYYALDGVSDMTKAIAKAQEVLNEDLKLNGAFLTMVDSRLSFVQHVMDEVKDYFKESLYKTYIRRSIKITEAQSENAPIQLYQSNNLASHDYQKLAKEMLNRS